LEFTINCLVEIVCIFTFTIVSKILLNFFFRMQQITMQANQEDSGMVGDYDVSDGIADDVTDGRKTVTYLDDKKSNMRMMRRTKSVARAEEITKEAEKVRRSQPDKP